jgi:hypothetical protein
MRGRDYLELAREILSGGMERHWRGAVGRAYYALFLEGREALARWSFLPSPADSIHYFVRARFIIPANTDLKKIGVVLEYSGRLRNSADYNLSAVAAFRSGAVASVTVQDVADAIALLDAMEADPVRLKAAVDSIKAAFP